MIISTDTIDTEKIKEDLIVASAAFMALKPYKAYYDSDHNNYFITKETVENTREELFTTLETIEKELHSISRQIRHNHIKKNPIENEKTILEDLRKIFAICDYCLSHKEGMDD